MKCFNLFLIGLTLGMTVGTLSTVVYKDEQMKRFKESAIKHGAGFYKADPETGITIFYWNALLNTPKYETKSD